MEASLTMNVRAVSCRLSSAGDVTFDHCINCVFEHVRHRELRACLQTFVYCMCIWMCLCLCIENINSLEVLFVCLGFVCVRGEKDGWCHCVSREVCVFVLGGCLQVS